MLEVIRLKARSTQPKIDLVLGRVTLQRGEMTASRSPEAKAGTWRLVFFSPSPHGMFWGLVVTGQQAGDEPCEPRITLDPRDDRIDLQVETCFFMRLIPLFGRISWHGHPRLAPEKRQRCRDLEGLACLTSACLLGTRRVQAGDVSGKGLTAGCDSPAVYALNGPRSAMRCA